MGGSKALPKSSFNAALSYMIKSYIGPGCLSLPLAFQRSGIVLGTFMLVSLFVIIILNLRSLVLCKRHWESKGVKTYADLAFVTIGFRGKQLIEWLVNLTQLGICSVYFDFVAENLNAMLPDSVLSSTMACMAYAFPVFGALALLPSVESIAPYTGLANVLIFLTIIIVLIYSLLYLGTSGAGEGITYGRASSSPLFFATAVYSFEGIANLLPVENSLEDRSQIWTLLYSSMAVVGFVYASVGILCYVAWPDTKAGSITAELSASIGGPILAISSWMVIVAVIFTFPVQLFPAVELLELRLGFTESKVQSSASQAAKHEREGFQEVSSESTEFDENDDNGAIRFDSPSGSEDGVELTDQTHSSSPMHRVLSDLPLPSMTDSEIDEEVDRVALELYADDDDDDEPDDLSDNRSSIHENGNSMDLIQTEQGMSIKRKIFRVGLVFATWMAAVLVPNLGALIALIGAISGSLLAIILPAYIDLKCERPNGSWKRTLRNYTFLLIGIIGGAWGSALALIQAVNGESVE